MTFTDPIGDMFSRIRNGQLRFLNSIEIPSSNFSRNILEILKREGWDAKTKFNPYRGYLLSDKNITEEKDNWKSVYLKK